MVSRFRRNRAWLLTSPVSPRVLSVCFVLRLAHSLPRTSRYRTMRRLDSRLRVWHLHAFPRSATIRFICCRNGNALINVIRIIFAPRNAQSTSMQQELHLADDVTTAPPRDAFLPILRVAGIRLRRVVLRVSSTIFHFRVHSLRDVLVALPARRLEAPNAKLQRLYLTAGARGTVIRTFAT
eukprot:3926276-Pleurochrysis_carterae.AAC.4